MITDHEFVGLRQWGMFPTADKPCQHEGCGMPKGQHARLCRSVLIIKGESFRCDVSAPHRGWAHANKEAEAIWGEGEHASKQESKRETAGH